jgi:hypothetical protein
MLNDDRMIIQALTIRPATLLLLAITCSFSFAIIGGQVTPVRAWSEIGHMIIASRAADLLPQPWSSFFNYYALTVNETTIYPDTIYKSLDPSEGPKHFIDLEVWNPNKPQTGTLPFAVAQYAAEMSQAIKSGDWNLMFIDAGRVAHYVGDIHQPYHSTVNYDPKNKHGTGLHSVLDYSLEAHVKEIKLLSRNDVEPLQPVENVTAFMFYIAWQSHSFLPTINRTLIDEDKSWSPELTQIVENRTDTAVISLARVWYTAILNAAQQPPSIPSPNKLQITIENPSQQVLPDQALSVSFTVRDSLGIGAILKPEASIGGIPLEVYNDQGLETPFGKYTAVIQPEILKDIGVGSQTLEIVASQAGFEQATAQLQIEVPQTQTTTTMSSTTSLPIEVVDIVLLVVVIAMLGVGLRFALRRLLRNP